MKPSKPKNYDPRFDSFANIDINKLAGKKQNLKSRIEKSRLIAESVTSKFEKALAEQELDRINDACIGMSAIRCSEEKFQKKMLEESKRRNEWRLISTKLSSIVLESLPFEPVQKRAVSKEIKDRMVDVIFGLFESGDINLRMFINNTKRNSDIIQKLFEDEEKKAKEGEKHDDDDENKEDDDIDNKELGDDDNDNEDNDDSSSYEDEDTNVNTGNDDDNDDSDDNNDDEDSNDNDYEPADDDPNEDTEYEDNDAFGVGGSGADDSSSEDNSSSDDKEESSSSSNDDLSKDIADAIKAKAIQLIKKEIKNAKQSDEVEDEIHDIKKDVSGSADNPDTVDPNAAATTPPATDPNADPNAAATTPPADATATDPNATATTPPATDPNAAATTPPADATQQPGQQQQQQEDDAFGVKEDYLDLYPDFFHAGHKLSSPTFSNQIFGKFLMESSKQLIKADGKLNSEYALGNATIMFCLYECLKEFHLINELNADRIFRKIVY